MVLAQRLKEIKHTLYLLSIYYVTNTDVKGWKHNCKQHQQDLWSYKQIRKHKQISKIISEGAKRCIKKKKEQPDKEFLAIRFQFVCYLLHFTLETAILMILCCESVIINLDFRSIISITIMITINVITFNL